MKVQVLTDDDGTVLAMVSEKSPKPDKKQGDGPTNFRMVPARGQRFRSIDIPKEVYDLELSELQRDYRVDLLEEPRLIKRLEKIKVADKDKADK
jgi:hypothetical protein